jgi:hypothetical protein
LYQDGERCSISKRVKPFIFALKNFAIDTCNR